MGLAPGWKRRSSWVGAVACALALLGAARPAVACSPDHCKHTGVTLPAEGQALPANLGGVLWREPYRRELREDAPPLQLHAVSSDGVMTELKFDRQSLGGYAYLRVVEELEPDSELVVTFDQEACGSRPHGQRSTRVKVTEAQPLPESLGHLTAEHAAGWLTVPASGGQCAQEVKAGYVDLALELSEDAQAFGDSLRYELRVDDEEAPAVFYPDVAHDYVMEHIGESSLGRGRDRLYTTCPRNRALEASGSDATYRPSRAHAPGPHRVRMIGILPDGTELATGEIEIDLSCPDDEAVFAIDAGSSDAAVPKSHQGDAPPSADQSAASSAGCSVAGVGADWATTPVGLGAWWWLVACASFKRRGSLARKRARCSDSS